MNIVIEICVVIIITILSWIYFSIQDFKGEQSLLSKIKNALFNHKKRSLYFLVMMVALSGMAISLFMIYPSNTLVANLKLIVLCGLLFPIAAIDQVKKIIPNKIILVGLVLRVVFYFAELFTLGSGIFSIIKGDLIACIIPVVFLLLGVFMFKNGIGMGDIKLLIIMCLFQGITGAISSIFVSLLIAFIISIALLISKKKGRKDAVPFAPSILIGTYISIILTGM